MSIMTALVPAKIAVDMVSNLVQRHRMNAQQSFPKIDRGSFAERMIGALDANGDGVLNLEEFRRTQGITMDESGANALFDRLDTDGDGLLTVSEVNAAIAERQLRQQAAHRAAGAIQARDADGDGALSALEFPVSGELFSKLDADGDGLIQHRELSDAHFARMPFEST